MTNMQAKAEQVLEAIKEQFKVYLSPLTMDDGSVLSPAYPPPVLMPYDDGVAEERWQIVWEEGPDEWPFTLDGGTSEEERVLFAQASEEFGATMTAPNRPAAKMPPGVFVEPINHISVGIYPA